MNNGVLAWYWGIPVITRTYLTLAVLTTTLCHFDMASPLTLYYNSHLIFVKGQYWRLLTSFLYFGDFSIGFVFNMYFLSNYSGMIETGEFGRRRAHFLVMLLIGSILIILSEPFIQLKFLGSALSFMMTYVWGKRNRHARMAFFGIFPFSGPYLPWILMLFSLMVGGSFITDLVGIAVGHVYYCIEFVYPIVAKARGWKLERLIVVPRVLEGLFAGRGGDGNDRIHFD